MKKQTIRLTESQLTSVIKESILNALNEYGPSNRGDLNRSGFGYMTNTNYNYPINQQTGNYKRFNIELGNNIICSNSSNGTKIFLTWPYNDNGYTTQHKAAFSVNNLKWDSNSNPISEIIINRNDYQNAYNTLNKIYGENIAKAFMSQIKTN